MFVEFRELSPHPPLHWQHCYLLKRVQWALGLATQAPQELLHRFIEALPLVNNSNDIGDYKSNS
jgi:O-acetylhomoserine/O-acetylserine sulfhydrylase-like pyridoxal-dependent enzyme